MRKTRLKILPARCLAMIGFLLLYLACPILAELSRAQPDRGLASFFQLQKLEHCASPPEDPGEGGCLNSRNAQMKMTRTVSRDNGHAHTCFTTDVFLLENTCSVDQRPEGSTEGHPKPVAPLTRTAPRRLLAARSKDAPEATLKVQAPRRQIKYRSLKRSHAPREELAIGSQRREAISTRNLLAARNGERTASERTDTTRRSLFMERGVPKRTAEKPLYRKISELKVPRRGSAEIQANSITAAEHAALAKESVSRKMSTEMRTSRRTMERKMSERDGSRRVAIENQSAPERPAGREFNVHSRASTERRSLVRVSRDHRLYQSDTRKLSGERKSERSVSSDSRNRELTVSRTTSATIESSRRIVAEHRLLENENTRRISSERQSSPRLASDRISEKLFRSRVSSKPIFSDAKLSRSASFDIRQDDSNNIRAVSERALTSRLTTERFVSERRSSSRVVQAEGRRSYAEGSLSRRNSLHEAVNSKRRCSTKRFPVKSIFSEGITAIRRTARSISSHTSTNSRVSSTFPFTGVIFRNSGRLYEGRPSLKSHDRLFRSLPSVQLLSSSSEAKQNEKQFSDALSRIKPRSLVIPRDKPSSRTLTDPTQTSTISKERFPKISGNRLSPSSNSIDRNAGYRTADNRRNSASAFEERRSMQLSRERRSLSSESSHRLSSFVKAEESLPSSVRSSPLNSIVTTRFSEERRVSRASPITRRLLTTSAARLSANISDRRMDQTVSSRLSVFTAPRKMSNERVLAQRSKMRRTVSPSVSDRRLSIETHTYRNSHVTESIARHNLIRTSTERALVLKDSKRQHAEDIIALTDSIGVSTRRITSENDSRSTKGLITTRDSRKVSAKQRTPVTGSRRFTERLNSAKFSAKISTERLTLEKDLRRSAERLASVGDSMRISAERLRLSRSSENSAYAKLYRRVSEKQLMPERNSKRYDEGLASIKNSRRVSATRWTSERQSRMSDEPFSQARDSMRITPDSRKLSESTFRFRDSQKLSADRQALERNSKRSVKRSLSVRNSRTILTGLKNPTDSSRSEERLSLLSNSRKNLAERTATLRYLQSTESLPFLRVSRTSSRGLEHQRSSKGPAKRLVTLRHSRIDIGRITTQRNSRSAEYFTPLRDSRTSTERLVTRHYRPLEHLTSSRDSRTISTERLISQRSAELSGRFKIGTDSTRSSERINVNRNYRIKDEPVAFMRASRSISSERLSFKRNSRVTSTVRTARRTNGDLASATRHRISPEEMEIQNNFKLSAVRLALVKGSRGASTEHLSQGSRRSAERIPNILGMRRTTATRQISERNLSRKTERSSYVRSPKMSSNRWAYERESRRTVKPLALVDSRKVTGERYSSRSAEHLTSVRSSRISAELKTMRNSGRSVDRFTSVRNSGILAERIGSDRRSVDRLVSIRDFRTGYTEPLESETNSERSLVGLATNLNSRRIYTERLVSERNSKRSLGHSANLRNTRTLLTNGLSSVRNTKGTAERLKSLGSSVRVTHERQPVSKKSTSDHLATSKSMDRVSTRINSSERRISQPEHLSTIRITSKGLVHRDATRMPNMRNIRQANGHISKNQVLHQGFGLPEKYFSTMDNTTLKTESFFDIALSMEKVQKSAVGFISTQYFNWSEKVTEFVNCVLATLTVMWPALAIWKEGVTSLISFDEESTFPPKLDHLNSFFTEKPISNYAFVPDGLTLFDSTKTSPPVMRDSHSTLTAMVGGGVTAAVMLLSTRSK